MIHFNLSSLLKPVKSQHTVERNYVLVSLLLIFIASLVSFSNMRGPLIELYDYGEHAACIRELSVHPFKPQNPLLAIEGATTLRYTPYIFLLGIITRFTQLNLFTLISAVSILSLFLLILGVYLWSKEYFHSEALPLYVLITLLFLWGKPFEYSNAYNLRFLIYSLFYPSTVSFNLSFLGLYFITKLTRYEKSRDYFFYLLLSIFIVMTHPLTGSFFLLCSFLLIITEAKKRLSHLVLYVLSLMVMGTLSLLWPYYPILDAITKSTSTDWYSTFRMTLYSTNNIYKIGPALLGLPIILFFITKKQYQFIGWGFLSSSLIYLVSFLTNIGLGERYIFFVVFFLHLSLAWYFSTLRLLSYATIKNTFITLSEKNLHVLFFSIVVILSLAYQFAKLGFEQAGYLINFEPMPVITRYNNPLDHYALLKGKIGKGDVVMTDPVTGWLLPALTGAKIISLYHNNPFVIDNDQRIADTITFYSPATSLKARKAILEKYGITKVLLNFNRMEENEINQIGNAQANYSICNRLIDDLHIVGKVAFDSSNLKLFVLH